MSELAIRRCRRGDLPALEWDGVFRTHAPLFARMFERAERGEAVMLVAADGGEHVGQIWIDLARDREGALLWALRVKRTWRGRGVGRRLIASAERAAHRAGRRWVEIEVDPDNARARRLYEHLGYRWIGRGYVTDAATGRGLELDTLRRDLGRRRLALVRRRGRRGRGARPGPTADHTRRSPVAKLPAKRRARGGTLCVLPTPGAPWKPARPLRSRSAPPPRLR